ncbi:hypothetical protein SK128_000449 [Halocaridina rubra]|uniref:Elongator complex protein 5 n=1 Tax=Halocaridina rubra TaxID=373956 RepID=A0AAN9AFB3_HALRR
MSTVILRKILCNSESPTPKLLLLTDSSDVSGRGVLYTLLKSHLSIGNYVQYLTTSNPLHVVKTFLNDEEFPGKIKFYDGFSDPCGWDSKDSCVHLNKSINEIFSSCDTGQAKRIFVIDKVDDIVNHQDTHNLIHDLHRFSADDTVEQVVVYCGRDCVPESFIISLNHLSSAVIHLYKGNPTRCKVILKKPSGKIVKTYEEFTLSPELKVQETRAVQLEKEPRGESTDEDAVLAAQTTFNLTLTEEQRKSKNKLLLPHTRVQSSGGQILYTPDDEDDWDEEDPDDDLNI